MNPTNAVLKTKFSWPKTPSMNQNFSFPDTIIYYVLMNPSSPKCYNKIIKSCKYFFEKNPILVVGHMDGWENGTIFCEKQDCSSFFNSCCVRTDISKIKAKIWITKKFSLRSRKNISHLITMLCQKIFRCEISYLALHYQTISIDDFILLSSSVTYIDLYKNEITYSDGNPVMFEAILEALPNVDAFCFTFKSDYLNATSSTFKNINNRKKFDQLTSFNLYKIPEVFNVKDLSNFIMNYKDTRIFLYFNDSISEDYQRQLDGLVDTIIESNIPNRLIHYRKQDAEKQKILDTRWDYGDEDSEKCESCG